MTEKLWGGRFKKKTDSEFFEFQRSIAYDHKLAEYDIAHSLIHVGALAASGILSGREASKLSKALKGILATVKTGAYVYDEGSEDIHTDIQNKVEKKVGKLSLKLHSLRSRNDQVAFDMKYYSMKKGIDVGNGLAGLIGALLKIGKASAAQPFVGYTHTRRAQMIGFGQYTAAYAGMFKRDFQKIDSFCERLVICLGAGALTGTAIPGSAYSGSIKKAGLSGEGVQVAGNPLDHVSDRDFAIELLSILALVQMHLSRLAEDMILYSTTEYGLIDLPEEFCTGSSLMPHKKNPDFLELVRGNTGKIYGNLMSVLTMMKGLPLAYNRDMQLDKEPLFSSVETVENELKIMAKLIAKIKVNKATVKKILTEDLSLYATELAEWLVIKHKVPFKTAHDCAGRVTVLLEKHGNKLDEIEDDLFLKIHPALKKSALKKIMTPEYASKMKKTLTTRMPRLKK